MGKTNAEATIVCSTQRQFELKNENRLLCLHISVGYAREHTIDAHFIELHLAPVLFESWYISKEKEWKGRRERK